MAEAWAAAAVVAAPVGVIQVRSRARRRLTARPATRTTPAMTSAVTAPQGERTGTQPTWRSRRSPVTQEVTAAAMNQVTALVQRVRRIRCPDGDLSPGRHHR